MQARVKEKERIMSPVTVTVCTGRSCYVAGAAHLKQLDAALSPKLKSQIRLTGTDCPGYCAAHGCRCAPRVQVNDRVLLRATPGEVLRSIRECLAGPAPRQLVA